jgi:transposase
MAKDQEKNVAFFLFTNEGLNAQEIAKRLNVRPNTIGDWIKAGNWKKIQDANLNQKTSRLDRIHEVIDELSTERLEIIKTRRELEESKKTLMIEIREVPNKNITDDLKNEVAEINSQIKDLKRSAVFVDQGIAMWNKTLQSFHQDNKITLTIYIEMMNRVFEDMRAKDEKLYMKTLDFQHTHLLEATQIFD